jgi:8-oxo-dGTP pyrophosphatase MutT (NUDIX family)
MITAPLAAALARYRVQDPRHAVDVDLFEVFLHSAPDVFERSHGPGHFTGSAWLVSADGRRVLLTHHRKLELWLQPGGHADGDTDLSRVALKEAEEETGVAQLRLLDGEIFDLDRHSIPARKSDPDHFHYDVRYVVVAGEDERFVVTEESHALAWRDIAELADDPQADASVRRMARKWLARQPRMQPR